MLVAHLMKSSLMDCYLQSRKMPLRFITLLSYNFKKHIFVSFLDGLKIVTTTSLPTCFRAEPRQAPVIWHGRCDGAPQTVFGMRLRLLLQDGPLLDVAVCTKGQDASTQRLSIRAYC